MADLTTKTNSDEASSSTKSDSQKLSSTQNGRKAAISTNSSSHTSRLEHRRQTLDEIFTVTNMENAWKKYVQSGMRSQYWPDLHDYQDFHRNRRNRLQQLRDKIKGAEYRPQPPIFLRSEKSNGICRRIAVPVAEDAIVLQTIVETISPKVLRFSPSENSFYSRSHRNNTAKISVESEYIWFIQYKKFSKKLGDLSEEYPYLIITDIANYFDNINLASLRNVISGIIDVGEDVLDFLFYVLESFSWRPDYLPDSGRGLPQVDFDAPRLLAHAYLFEVDRELVNITSDTFVRWMDDIDTPCESIEDAKNLLCRLDDLMASRGLRLNGSKTKILSAEQAREYLHTVENKFLDDITDSIKLVRSEDALYAISEILRKRFKKFHDTSRSGRWDKVLKRYINLFSRTKDTYAEEFCKEHLFSTPSVRDTILMYYAALGPSGERFDHIKDYLLSRHSVDDVSVFASIRVLVDWQIDWTDDIAHRIRELSRILEKERRHSIAGPIWLNAKYSESHQLRLFIEHNKSHWLRSNFNARQVAATLPRLRNMPNVCKMVEKSIADRGLSDAISVINSLEEIRIQNSLSSADMLYLKHGNHADKRFPLQKFLFNLEVLRSENINEEDRSKLKIYLMDSIKDPIYRMMIATT